MYTNNKKKYKELVTNILTHYEDDENGGDFKSCTFCTNYECYRCKYAKLNTFLTQIFGDNKTPREMTVELMSFSMNYMVAKAIFYGLTEPYKGLDEDITSYI